MYLSPTILEILMHKDR